MNKSCLAVGLSFTSDKMVIELKDGRARGKQRYKCKDCSYHFVKRDFVTGSRAASTGKRLREKVKGIACASYATDDWEAYKAFLLEHKHLTDKAETTSIESGNSNVRHYLARFRRRTKCY